MALDTSSSAFSLSAEMGHTFRFINDAAYVEPQIEFTYGFIGGDDATASNSVRIEQDDFQSFVTRVGVRAGYDFPQKKGSVYGMFSYSYDWMGDADGTASKDGACVRRSRRISAAAGSPTASVRRSCWATAPTSTANSSAPRAATSTTRISSAPACA